MDVDQIFQAVMIALQLALGALVYTVLPWGMRVSERLARLEAMLQNGMSSDLKAIKQHCIGCKTTINTVERRVDKLEREHE